jgi:hypothetical protein
MSKERARKRAKAKAAAKAAGKDTKSDIAGGKPDVKPHPGKFDPHTQGMKGASVNIKGGGAQRRGAARSR